jgi:hypothetical protein
VGQVFEHLCIANESYLRPMRGLIEGASGSAAGSGWKPSLAGRLLVSVLRSQRKFPAPKVYQPGPAPRTRVVEAFLAQLEEIERLLARTHSLDLRALHFSSPVTRFIRLNLGDGFAIMITHAERHLNQTDRLRGHAAFPRV